MGMEAKVKDWRQLPVPITLGTVVAVLGFLAAPQVGYLDNRYALRAEVLAAGDQSKQNAVKLAQIDNKITMYAALSMYREAEARLNNHRRNPQPDNAFWKQIDEDLLQDYQQARDYRDCVFAQKPDCQIHLNGG